MSESEELSVTRVRLLLLLLTMASLCVDAEQRNKMQRAGALAARASNELSRRFHNSQLIEFNSAFLAPIPSPASRETLVNIKFRFYYLSFVLF